MNTRECDSEEPTSIWRSPYTKAVLICLVVIPLMRPLLRFEPPPPDPMFALPTYSLIDSKGRDFGSEDLVGKVYITSFFAASCKTACARNLGALAQLEQRFQENRVKDVHLLSISVDSEVDTPERLRELVRSRDIDEENWTLLTGSAAKVRALLGKGFGLSLVESDQAAHPLLDLAHRRQLVMVDRQGQVRGFYRDDELGLDEVFHRTRHVLGDRRRKMVGTYSDQVPDQETVRRHAR